MQGDVDPRTRGAGPKPRPVGDLAAASADAGFNVAAPTRLPAGLPARPSSLAVTSGETLGFTFRADKARAYLASINRGDVSLPPQFDGASLRVSISPAVILFYAPPGAGAPAADVRPMRFVQDGGVVLVETRAPSLDASGVSAEQPRSFLLSLPGIPPSTRAQLQAIGDWRHTLPLPVPPEVSAQKTQVNGAPAVVYAEQKSQIAGAIIWLRDGVIYAAAGPLNQGQLVDLAASLK